MPTAGNILDGYRLIRPIGRGGFGEVWLCQVEATGERKALKFLSASDPGQLERELAALIRYRGVASQLQCPHLVSIEHVNRVDCGLFYTMPLADGLHDLPPDDSSWCPKTLSALIADRKLAPAWFSAAEIREIMIPILHAVQQLSDVGIIHRDIKPENILFMGGRPCLGDISLLADDTAAITRRGTPGYTAPSWYLETGGNPDMWGLATTLYSLVTGNSPDKLGRGAFLWPPQGEQSVDRKEWSRFHQIVLRATHEKALERYLGMDAFKAAFLSHDNQAGMPAQPDVPANRRFRLFAVLGMVGLLMVGGIGWWLFGPSNLHDRIPSPSPKVDTQPLSDLKKQLATVREEFYAVLAEARHETFGEDTKRQPHVLRLRPLLDDLQAERDCPLSTIRQTLDGIKKLIPYLAKEVDGTDLLSMSVAEMVGPYKAKQPFNKATLDRYSARLQALAMKPYGFIKNADEQFCANPVLVEMQRISTFFSAEEISRSMGYDPDQNKSFRNSIATLLKKRTEQADREEINKLVNEIELLVPAKKL